MDVHCATSGTSSRSPTQLHFTRAAETLYVSQPALSKQIRALERQLRVTLFERDRGSVRLTRAGAELLPHAERMVASWESAKSALSRASDCALVIGMHTSPGRGLLPKVRAMMVASCPEAELELRQVPWSDRTAGLADRSTDAAFVWLPLPQPPYRWVTIARETRLVALANDHRLAARASVAMADLLDEPFLALPHERRPAARLTGSPATSAMGTRCASRPRSTTPRRPTKRSRAASASACSRRATLRSSRAAP